MIAQKHARAALYVGAVSLLCCTVAFSQKPPATPARVLIDDLESYQAYEQWTVSGGPEASVTHAAEVRHSGEHSVRFRVKVDYRAAGNPKYPKGWLFLNRNFDAPQDWSAYKGLEFYLFVPAGQPLAGQVIKYGIATQGAGAGLRWKTVSADAVQPGAWVRIVVPLGGSNVRGDLRRVMRIRFYVAENWYADGDELNFYLDDFALLKELKGEGGSEWIRPAGPPLKTPRPYLKQSTPAIYPVLPLEFIYPDTDLSRRKPVEALALRAARGETKALTFAVLAGAANIKDLSLTVSDLKGPAGAAIPSRAVDARVVKVWEQAALHWEVLREDDKILVPELLLKDDRFPFDESRDERGEYHAPHVSSVPFGTDVPAHTLKQVWLNIDAPAEATPGAYEGVLTLRAKAGLPTRRIPLRLQVLPFRLPAPKLLYGIYYRWRPWTTGRFAIPEDRFLADLKALKDAGFEAVTLYNPAQAEKWLQAMSEIGMKGPVVMMGIRNPKQDELARLVAACRQRGIACYFYGVDEPNDKKRTEQHKRLSALLHRAGGKVMTAIVPATAQKLVDAGEPLDWANHAIPNAAPYLLARRGGKVRKTAAFETYYWQVYEENPTRNRLLCGFYLWASGLEGAFPYEYQAPIGLPYTHDTRTTMHRVKKGGKPRTFRAWCLTYPSREGPVSTLQWEGCRMGVNDVRYLTLLESLIGELRKRGRTAQAKTANARMAKIIAAFTRLPADPSVFTNPYVEPAKFEKARRQVVDLALEVKRWSEQ